MGAILDNLLEDGRLDVGQRYLDGTLALVVVILLVPQRGHDEVGKLGNLDRDGEPVLFSADLCTAEDRGELARFDRVLAPIRPLWISVVAVARSTRGLDGLAYQDDISCIFIAAALHGSVGGCPSLMTEGLPTSISTASDPGLVTSTRQEPLTPQTRSSQYSATANTEELCSTFSAFGPPARRQVDPELALASRVTSNRNLRFLT